ncbi:MAG: polyphosphate polymerase domain-containing protein [Oscillospiraceae bacterium]|jgi:hypothetical protein|nr:polyphosphate polymerase domain-containing protein [Oscillospiraceae bacterium]
MGNQMVFKRYEIKYLINRCQRDAILKAMEPYMTPDEYDHSSIRNIYYDTPDFRLIRESLEKPVYKEKLRVRSYGPYEREAFYERHDGDFRVTFDENIRYRQVELTLDSDAWGTPILKPEQVLMELKVSGALPLWMVHALSQQRIFKTSFSKYGTAYQGILLTSRKGVLRYA